MSILHLLITVVAGFAVSSVLGIWLIPGLRRLHFGQTILEIGPAWHKKKQGTPIMGGIMFIVGSILAAGIGYTSLYMMGKATVGSGQWYLVFGMLMSLGFAGIGFADDYIKAVKKQNLGLKVMQKMVAQVFIAAAYLFFQHLFDPTTMVWLPFLGDVNFGLAYYPVMMAVIIGTVNAVNITDGVDGLAASVTFMASMGFMVLAAMLVAPEVNLMAAALAGSCLGFLVWNFHPAKVFMGDTGSLYLGGMVVAMAFGLKMPVILLFVGIIYVLDTLSVILQVASFKLTGKRIFKMSPIHHHFELSGWSEIKIVAVFTAITLLGCAVAVALTLQRL